MIIPEKPKDLARFFELQTPLPRSTSQDDSLDPDDNFFKAIEKSSRLKTSLFKPQIDVIQEEGVPETLNFAKQMSMADMK